MKFFWKGLLYFLGWDLKVTFPHHHLPKYLIIVGPHTSGWDFIIGLAYRNILNLNKVKFLGKKELFQPPHGFLFRWLGGRPVDRGQPHHVVDEVVAMFNNHDQFYLALSPEGTRKKVDHLRSGFYYVALQSEVPIIMVGLDFWNKTILISKPIMVTGDQKKDLESILAFFRTIKGKIPENGLMHL